MNTSEGVGRDDEFLIELLRHGTGTPILFATGFLTEGDKGWGGWERMVRARYPDAPVCRMHWGSEHRRTLGARIATAAAIPPGPSQLAALYRNPWTRAKKQADAAGTLLADWLTRNGADRYVLAGHSLGARLMATATAVLGTRQEGPEIESVHLLGAAIGADHDWSRSATLSVGPCSTTTPRTTGF